MPTSTRTWLATTARVVTMTTKLMTLMTLMALVGGSSAAAQSISAGGTTLGLTIQRTVTGAAAVGTIHGLDVDQTTGRVFFIADGGRDLYVLETNDTMTRIVDNGGQWQGILSDLAMNDDGVIHVLSTEGPLFGTLQRFTQTGMALTPLATGLVVQGNNSGQTGNAAGIDFNCVGDAHVGEVTDVLSRITPAGVVSQATTGAGWVDIDEVVQTFDNEMFILDGSSRTAEHRTVFVVRANGTVQRWATNVGVTTTQVYSAAFDRTTASLYVGDYANGVIYRLRDTNADGFADESIQIATGFGTNNLADVAVGPASTGTGFSVYVSRGGTRQIIEITGLGTPLPIGCGRSIDDDGDGFCEDGQDTDGDGDCDSNDMGTGAVDCDDNNALRSPALAEICTDGIDNDCNVLVDDGPACTTITGPSGQILGPTTTPTGTSNVADGTTVTVSVTGPGGYTAMCSATVMSRTWSCASGAIAGLVSGAYTMDASVSGMVRASGMFDVVDCFVASDCDDSLACTTDTCSMNSCSNTSVAAGLPGSCTGGDLCSGAPADTCGACADTSPSGTDAGCVGAAPHCNTAGGGAVCEPCLDTNPGGGPDLGCGGSTPFCAAGMGGNACVACLTGGDCVDGNTCTQDVCVAGACSNPPVPAGTACAGGVCDGLGSALCEVCVDSGTGTDDGCSAAAPFCIGASGMRQCVECVGAGDCDDGVACTADACTANACANASVTAGDVGACTGGLVCSGAPTDACVTCADTDGGAGTDAGCTGGAPFCASVGGMGVTCEVCVDAGAGTDPGCGSATPNCVVGTGGANLCVSCVNNTDCGDGNECTSDVCVTGMCTNPALPELTPCSGGVCNATAVCSGVVVSIDAPADGSSSADAMPTLSGTGTPGGTVTLTLDSSVVGVVVVSASGTWSLVLSSPLTDGPHTLLAELSAGASDAMDTSSFDVDTATAVTIDTPADGGTSLDATPLIRGSGEPGASVVVSVDGSELDTVVVGSDGLWMLAVSSPLTNGMHTITAVATDTAGNTANAQSDFTVAADTDVSITSPVSGAVITQSTPTITGTAQPGASVVVALEIGGSAVPIGTVVADSNGDWSVTVSSALADGRYFVTADATDLAGNMAQDSSAFTVDTATSVSIDAVDPGTGTVSGTGEPGATVVVTIDGTDVGTTVVAADGTWSVVAGPLGVGQHTVVATATDALGNMDADSTVATVTVTDGGVPDGGVNPDGGVSAGVGGLSGGALCAARAPVGAGWPGAGALLLVGVAVATRRRRR